MPTDSGAGKKSGDYVRVDLKAPVLTGLPLKAFILLTETPLFTVVRSKLLRDNGYPQVLEERKLTETPLFYPDTLGWPTKDSEWSAGIQQDGDAVVSAQAAADTLIGIGDGSSSDSFGHSKVMSFYTAYIEKRITPSIVAERIIQALEESENMTPPMRFLIAHDAALLRSQAAASTARFASGNPLSVFDGVPFAVKDEVDIEGFQTTAGTAFLGAEREALGTVPGVSALLDAGALLVGKTNMHEIGLGTTGLNTHHGTPRNPHDVSRHTGGSSSGSASIVASGLCAFALGADGGGSIRIPSALCGCVGLKPTQDRICPHPGPQIAYTVGVIGPIAHSVADCALMYALLSNRGHKEHGMAIPPPLTLPDLSHGSISGRYALKGVTVGVHWDWFEHADDTIVSACKKAVQLLKAAGATIVPIEILHIREVAIAHTATIAPEMRSAFASYYNTGSLRRQLSAETRISLATAGAFTAPIYMSAQKIRRKADLAMKKVFQSCDIIATPTVPILAPPVLPASLDGGASDLATTVALMRYSQLGNMLGLPGITVPVGNAASVEDGSPTLPIGLQLMATPWQEASLLHAGAVLEAALGHATRSIPAVYWDLLSNH